MRFAVVLASLLGLAAASPCKKSSSSSPISTIASSTSVSSTEISISSTQTSASSTEVTSSVASSTSSVSSATTNLTTTSPSSVSSISSSSSSSSATSATVVSTSSVSSSSATSTSISSSSSSSSATSATLVSTTSVSSSSATPTSVSSSSVTSTSISSTSVTTTAVSSTSATSTSISSTSSTSSIVSTTPSPSSTIASVTSTGPTPNPATAVVTNPVALTYYDPYTADGTAGRQDQPGYICYAGPSINFPSMSTWASFNSLFSFLTQVALSPIGDSATEVQAIRSSILDISTKAKVDPRVILAIIVDESTGNVRVGCTTSFGGVPNCGLMQSYNGTSFDAANPADSIHKMIQDGTQGTIYGPGLVQLLNAQARSNGNLWTALRLYNSGSADLSNLSDGRGATDAYVSNIANFLQGWQGFGSPGPVDCDFSLPFNTMPVAT